MIYLDTETCGLCGPVVLIQYAEDGQKPTLHEVWRRPARDTLRLIERFAASEVCAFNLVFDWWHLQRAYCVLSLLPPDAVPTREGWRDVERRAVFGPCVRPQAALDLFLALRKGRWQSLMERSPIRIRKVPASLAAPLCAELDARVAFDSIYFARRSEKFRGWQAQYYDDAAQLEAKQDEEQKKRLRDPLRENGTPKAWADVVLRFGASMGLKPICRHLLGVEALDFPVEKSKRPKDKKRGWDPFDKLWWPLLGYHVAFWATNRTARRYAADDVTLLQRLRKHLGNPSAGDTDSELACQVASARWRGYATDRERLEAERETAVQAKAAAPRAAQTVAHRLRSLLSPIEAVAVKDTTAATLDAIARSQPETEAGRFAKAVAAARTAEKRVTLIDKLLTVGRLHPALKVIAAKSGRMGGAGGLNVQGIDQALRGAFLLADGDLPNLQAGDFDAFEVAIFEATAADPKLRAMLLSGRKIHAVYGAEVYGASYEEIMADPVRYTAAKSALFAGLYGAQPAKIAQVLGLPLAVAEAGLARFLKTYPGVGAAQARTAERFCSMRQPGGIGSRVEWHEPAQYAETLFGFRRSFELENGVCRALFELAQDTPESLRSALKVTRRKGRTQTAGGAIQSALFGAAFQIQAANMRAAGNHEIQGSGAHVTKELQLAVWEHQPRGVHPWRVQPLQIHDEIQCPTRPGLDLTPTVAGVLERFRPTIPLIAMDWQTNLPRWSK